MSRRRALSSGVLATRGSLLGCTVSPHLGTPGALVGDSRVSATEERIVVHGGGRDIRSVVLLSDRHANGAGANPDDINVAGFSQRVTVALELTRRLDRQHPGVVRCLFLAVGSAAVPLDASLALRGTDLIAYQPAHNGPQAVANVLTGEPGTRRSCQRSSKPRAARPSRTTRLVTSSGQAIAAATDARSSTSSKHGRVRLARPGCDVRHRPNGTGVEVADRLHLRVVSHVDMA